jgi:hypothetical protein
MEPLRTLASGSISGTYTAVGTPFVHPIRILWIQNTTNAQVTFSLDGVNDHFILPAGGYVIVDVSSNKDATSYELYLPIGTQIYVMGTVSSGAVYISTFYGVQP